MISLITTTRERPEAFGLLQKWVRNQTIPFDQWVVVTDGAPDGYSFDMNQDVIVREPKEGDLHSVCENVLAGLKAVKGDRVVVMDDDDYFAPTFLETLVSALDEVALAGLSGDIYFHLPARRFCRMHNQYHASLTCTAFRKGVKKEVAACARLGDPLIDIQLWDRYQGGKRLLPNGWDRPLHLGMKGSRTANVGLGNNPHGWSGDRGFVHLRGFLGLDAADYIEIATKKLPW